LLPANKAENDIGSNRNNNNSYHYQVPSTSEDPAIVKRGIGQSVLHLCIRNTNTEDMTWYLSAVDPKNIYGAPEHGLHVTIDKSSIFAPKYAGAKADFGRGLGNLDHFNVYISADKSADLGLHQVLILATYHAELNHDFVFGYAIVVNTVE
jgi:hypothetical protein